MFTKLFYKDLLERAVSTVVQVLLGFVTATQFNLLQADWAAIGVTVLTAVIVVVLKAFVAVNLSPSVSPASLAKDSRGV